MPKILKAAMQILKFAMVISMIGIRIGTVSDVGTGMKFIIF
jgi:hypothetical protein